MSEQQNGSGPALDLEHVLDDDAVFLELARRRLEVVRIERDELVGKLATVSDRVKRYEKTVRDLDPDYESPGVARRGRPPKGDPVRATPSRVGPDRMERVEAAFRRLAEGGDEIDVRQIDVTKETGLSSAVMAPAFRQLRDAGVIRFAGEKKGRGGGKFFRLTREALVP